MQRVAVNSLIAICAVAIFSWILWAYDTSLRDPQYFDGWILFSGMLLQLFLHIRKQFPAFSLGRAASWLQAHIYGGYVLVIMFAFHTGATLPDGFFEWILWTLFLIVALSGAVGSYLTWSIPARLEHFPIRISFETMPAMRFKLAKDMEAVAAYSASQIGSKSISELYAQSLSGFFKAPKNIFAHLRNSRRPLTRLISQIDDAERYADPKGQETLRQIKGLVYRKDQLDYQYAHHWLLQTWSFIHIPATHCLFIAVIVHIAAVYAYSTGAP